MCVVQCSRGARCGRSRANALTFLNGIRNLEKEEGQDLAMAVLLDYLNDPAITRSFVALFLDPADYRRTALAQIEAWEAAEAAETAKDVVCVFDA